MSDSRNQTFYADSSPLLKVFLNGESVEHIAVAFSGSSQPNDERDGWVALIKFDESGKVVMTPTGGIATHTVYGKVRWEPTAVSDAATG